VQPQMMLPWTPPILAGSWLAFRALRSRWRREEFDRGLALSGWWFWSLLLGFSLSPEKRDLYLLPAYPAAALLAARWIIAATSSARASRMLDVVLPALLVLIGVALCFTQAFEAHFPAGFEPLSWQPIAVGVPLIVAAAFAIHAAWRADHVRAAILIASGVAVSGTIAALCIFPRVNALKSSRSLSAYLSLQSERPSVIPCLGVMPESYRFYTSMPFVHGPFRNGVQSAAEEAVQREFIAIAEREGPQFLALVERKHWERWSAATRAHFEIRHERIVGTRHVLVLAARTN